MSARRVITVTVPVDGRSAVAFESYRDRKHYVRSLAVRRDEGAPGVAP